MKRARSISMGLLSVLLYALPAPSARGAEDEQARKNVVYLLLDTTSAERMSGWGNSRATTPNIDALAQSGVRFARHFANSHATRPSMPQLMSGRYYQSTILREFRPRTHPRDWPFVRPDPSIALLPEILRDAGYRLLAVSAHPWITRQSRFGTPFDVFDEPTVPAKRGHADAHVLVDRALALWWERPRDRPTFLYVHFMDTHIPRYVAPGDLKFGVEDPTARSRFDAAGEPTMDNPWHDWDRSDARAFTAKDVEFFTAVYDTMLARLDAEVGRLVEAIRADDPELGRTLIVVTADHGEELGEHGRISHEDSLDDAIQHVPLVLSGGSVLPGQVAWGITEHVDVVPTVIDALGVPSPEGARFDGRPLLAKGRVCTSCLRSVAYFAWEDYRAVRIGRKLLREELPSSFQATCLGTDRLEPPTRRGVAEDMHAAAAGRRLVARTLNEPEATFRATRYSGPETRFSVLPPFWRTSGATPVRCIDAGPDTPRSAFHGGEWIWTGRGLLLLSAEPATPSATIILEVPDGDYLVDLGVRDVPPPPRFFGYARWLRKRIRPKAPKDRIPVGVHAAAGGALRLEVPAAIAVGHHILAVQLRPVGAPDVERDVDAGRPERDTTLRDRLRTLGYLE